MWWMSTARDGHELWRAGGPDLRPSSAIETICPPSTAQTRVLEALNSSNMMLLRFIRDFVHFCRPCCYVQANDSHQKYILLLDSAPMLEPCTTGPSYAHAALRPLSSCRHRQHPALPVQPPFLSSPVGPEVVTPASLSAVVMPCDFALRCLRVACCHSLAV